MFKKLCNLMLTILYSLLSQTLRKHTFTMTRNLKLTYPCWNKTSRSQCCAFSHTYVCVCIYIYIYIYIYISVKVKEKFTLEQATKPRGGVEVYLYSFFNFGAKWGGWSTPRSGRFNPGKTRYPLYRRLGGPRAGLTGAENLAPTGIRSPDLPARSESLYRLRYPGPSWPHIYSGIETHIHKHFSLYFCLFLSLLFPFLLPRLQGWYLNRILNILNPVIVWLLRISVAFWKIWK